MNKEEFLAELRSCLEGKMSPSEIGSNVDYYSAYIDGEIMKGRSETEVLEELGPARLIAKTLTANIKDEGPAQSAHEERSGHEKRSSGEQYEEDADEPYEEGTGRRKANVGRILGIVICILIVLLLIVFGFSLVRGAFYLLIRFFPMIVIAVIILSVFRGASGRR